jgi:hypothetical protein
LNGCLIMAVSPVETALKTPAPRHKMSADIQRKNWMPRLDISMKPKMREYQRTKA